MSVRKIISLCLAIASALCMTGSGAVSFAEELSVSAQAAILVCADSGMVLYEKNADERLPIASITKIMTAVIALAYAENDDKEIRFTKEMEAEGSSLYLKEGDVMTISELTAGMLCVSGNDAANALAAGIAGSTEAFAGLMNDKAAELGMTDTHFANPSGLDQEEHYSTARDMAALCRYAMGMDSFAGIVSQRSLTVHYVYPEGKTQVCVNHNKLLSLCDGCIGIKTGYTKRSGRTLTSCTEREGVRLIAVTLNAPDDWNDHRAMFDYGFAKTEARKVISRSDVYALPVVGDRSELMRVVPREDVYCTALKGEQDGFTVRVFMPHFVYAPQKKGAQAGRICVYRDGVRIAGTELVNGEDADIQTE